MLKLYPFQFRKGCKINLLPGFWVNKTLKFIYTIDIVLINETIRVLLHSNTVDSFETS